MHCSNLHIGCKGEHNLGSISNAVHTFFFIMYKWKDTNFVYAVVHNGSEKYCVLCTHMVELKCFWIFLKYKIITSMRLKNCLYRMDTNR